MTPGFCENQENTPMPTADEDKTRFELNYPIYILICHTPGIGAVL